MLLAWGLCRPAGCPGTASHLGCSSPWGGTRSPFSPQEGAGIQKWERRQTCQRPARDGGWQEHGLNWLSPRLLPVTGGIPSRHPPLQVKSTHFMARHPPGSPAVFLPHRHKQSFALQHHRLFESHFTDGETEARRGKERGWSEVSQ